MMKLVLMVPLLLLGACASGGHCAGEHEYQKAISIPATPAVEGIKTPESASALRIPPSPEQASPYAETVDDSKRPGKTRVRCLDVPPPLPEEPAKS